MKVIEINSLQELKNIQSDCRYVIKRGSYTVGTEDTREEFLYLSNNDGSVKNIAFYILTRPISADWLW